MEVGALLEVDKTITNLSPAKQLEQDRIKEALISSTQRRFRIECKGPQFATKVLGDIKRKIDGLEKQKAKLKLELSLACSKTQQNKTKAHLDELNSKIQSQIQTDSEIKAVLTKNEHIEFQINRLLSEEENLKKLSVLNIEASGKISSKAEKNINRLKCRLHSKKLTEGSLITKIEELRGIAQSMLYQRKLFNQQWSQLMKTLKLNRQILIDLIERSIVAFTQNSERINSNVAIREKVFGEKNSQVSEMLQMIQKADANLKELSFYKAKGYRREMCPLNSIEVKRREIVTEDLESRLTQYREIFGIFFEKQPDHENDIKEFLTTAKNFSTTESRYLAHFRYLNQCISNLDVTTTSLFKQIRGLDNLRLSNQFSKENRLIMGEQFRNNLNETKKKTMDVMKVKDSSKQEMINCLESTQKILNLCECGANVRMMLGENLSLNNFNLKLFLSSFEQRLNFIISYVYYRDKKSTARLIKLRPEPPKLVNICDFMPASQCSECAEREDVNRYDEVIVLPVEKSQVRDNVKEKISENEIEYRLHTLSKCRLPNSRVLYNKQLM